ncbi:MAG: glycerol-3-phosphate 1-O-acyltransferase PlsY [Oscillospiraceae bacterium]|nr:glycerol-3-phosphate 1-O-acyltransferase PlsY [Oscillospiraceae bacterium]
MIWKLAICAVMGYLLGSLNGALVISRFFKHEDVRTKGSGNAGLTNYHRNFGGWSTLLVIAIDMGKMAAAALLARLIYSDNADLASMVTGFCVFIGHILPVFFNFKGGKGILTAGALALVMDWRIFVILLVVFAVMFAATKYVSVGSIFCCFAYGICFALFFAMNPPVWIIAMVIALIAIFTHRGNIQRLLNGEERKTYLRKSKNK